MGKEAQQQGLVHAILLGQISHLLDGHCAHGEGGFFVAGLQVLAALDKGQRRQGFVTMQAQFKADHLGFALGVELRIFDKFVDGELLLVMQLVLFLQIGQTMTGMSGNISRIPLWLAAASVGFAVLMGMAAGFFPALRAMKLSPLAAIRNE